MPKLTDTQLVILSAAAGRDDRAVMPLPKSIKVKGGAVTTVLKSLIKRDLIAELPAKRGKDVWREDGGKRLTLVITAAGLNAIGVEPEQPKAARPGTKQALMIDLLKRKNGASIAEIGKATRRQAHSVRGAISGAIKKKLGLNVESEAIDGRGRVYRIVEKSEAA